MYSGRRARREASSTFVEAPVFNKRQPRHIIFSSDGTSLRMDDEMKRVYDKAIKDVENNLYRFQRLRFGIWASNQNKFVNHLHELNEYDCRIMEDRFAEYNK